MMTKIIVILLTVLLFIPSIYADESLSLVTIGERSVDSVQSVLDFTVENRGFDKALVSLPVGWDIDETADDHGFSEYRGYPVRDSGLWRIYGLPYDRTSYLGAYEASPYLSGKVWTGEGISQPYGLVEPSDQIAWTLYPNEKLVVHIELSLSGEGVVDPPTIQLAGSNYQWIRVTQWEQEFILNIDVNGAGGYVTAPWTVKGAKMTSASPAVTCNMNAPGCPGDKLWYDIEIKPQADIVEWDSWLPLKNSLADNLISTPPSTDEVSSVQQVVPDIKPLWLVPSIPPPSPEVRYSYEWKRDGKIEGDVTLGNNLIEVPVWYEWF